MSVPLQRPSGSRYRVLRVVGLAGLLLLLVAAGYAMWVPQPQVALDVLTASREADGDMRVEGAVSDRPAVQGQLSALKSNTSSSTATGTASSSDSGLGASSVAILNFGSGLLMERVGLALFHRLKEMERFQTVEYVPSDKQLPEGRVLPDLFVGLDAPEIQESRGLQGLNYKIRLVVTFGRHVDHSNTYSSTSESPPVVEFASTIEINFDGQQQGVETSGARYQAVSTELAKQIAEKIEAVLKGIKHPPLPTADELADFYPPFEPPPQFEFLTTLQARPLAIGSRLMQPTSATWTFTTDKSADDLWTVISGELTQQGWRVPEKRPDGDEFTLTLSHRDQSLAVFPARREIGQSLNEPATNRPVRYVVVYERSWKQDAIDAAVARLLDRQPSEQMLQLFRRWWYRDKERFLDWFEDHPPRLIGSLETLAEWKKKDDPDAARELVVRAYALDRIMGDGSGKSRLEKLAKDVGLEKLPETLPADVIAQLQLADLRTVDELTVTAKSGEPVTAWLADGDEPSFLTVTPTRRREGPWSIAVVVRSLRASGSSSTSSTQDGTPPADQPGPVTTMGLNNLSTEILWQAAADPDHVQLVLKRQAAIKSE